MNIQAKRVVSADAALVLGRVLLRPFVFFHTPVISFTSSKGRETLQIKEMAKKETKSNWQGGI